MNIILETFENLFPLYFFILVGLAVRKARIIPESMGPPLNRLIFMVFISASLFISTYQADLGQALDWKALVFAITAVLLQAGLGVCYAINRISDRPSAAVVANCFFRTNFGLHGIIYTILLFGAGQMGKVSILIAVIVPLYNVLSVLVFELMKGEKPHFLSVLIKVLKNPMVVAAAFALLLKLLGVTLPALILDPVNQVAAAAAPLSLIAAGSALCLSGLREKRKLIARASIARLLLVPLLTLPPAILLGFRGVTLMAFLVAFGGPVATPLPAMAFEMGGDGELAAQTVAVTSVFSLFTLHVFILLLRFLGLA
jgi:predicted permease